jgi:hypothetical protein
MSVSVNKPPQIKGLDVSEALSIEYSANFIKFHETRITCRDT